MPADSIVNPQLPLQQILPSYIYQQYADDANIVAFSQAYNTLAQAYLDWFNQTPFGVYTSPSVTGPLLDWIGQGIYGVPRPVFSTLSTYFQGNAIGGVPLNILPVNGSRILRSGTAVTANDDYYKRVLTWNVYIGDGRTVNIMTLRKRIARFLYGVNGTDVSLSMAQNVSIEVVTSPSLSLTITVPAGMASSYFQEGFKSGILPLPFQLAATVTIA